MKPAFDPNQPFEAVAEKPAFDPNQPFEAAEQPIETPRLTGNERQRSYLRSLREGQPEEAAGHGTIGPDLSGEQRTLEQNLDVWGEVGKGAAKAVPATIAGGVIGDVEGLGRAGINLLGSNPVVPFSVDHETAVPTTEEGGYLGPRGLGLMEASTTALEQAGSMVGSIVGPGLALKGAKMAVGAVRPAVTRTTTAARNVVNPPPSPAAFPEEIPFSVRPEAPIGVPREGGARLLPPETPHRITEDFRGEGPTRAGVGAEGAFGPLMDIRPEAINHLRAVMREEGWTPHTLEARLEEMSPHQFLGELSPNTESRLGGIATYPGQSRTEIVNTIQTRKAETRDRLRSSFNRAFGEPIDVAQETRINKIDQSRAASPLYREYESMRIHPTQAIQDLMPRLRGLEGAARQLARVEGQPFDQTFFVGGPNKVWPTARSWDQIKQAIDLKIDGSYNARGQATKWTRAYTQLKNDLLAAIEAPEQGRVGQVYREARRAFAEPASIETAMRFGDRVLNATIKADELPFLTAAYSEAEMNALRQGLRAHLEDKLGRPGVVERRTINEILSPNNEKKIRWIIGDEAADDLLRSIRHEHDMWDAPQRIYQGSPTSGREATRAEYGPQASWMDELTLGQVVGAVMNPVDTAMATGAKMAGKKHVSKSAAKKEAAAARFREDLAKLMTLQGPERDATLRWLFDTMDQAPKRFAGGRVERNRGGMARLHNNAAMKAKRLSGTPFKQFNDAVRRASGGGLSYTAEGYPFYENLPEGEALPAGEGGFNEQPIEPQPPAPVGLAASPQAPEDPFERAALRQRRSVGSERGLNAHAVSAPEDTSGVEEKVDWMLEPMLEQQQKGEYLPEGRKPEELAVDEFGRLIDKQSFEPIKMIERPGMLPLVRTPKGVEFAMPKILDVAGYLGGGWGAKVPVRGAEAVLGAGPVRKGFAPRIVAEDFSNPKWTHKDFGQGWFYNSKQRKLHGIEPGDLGPHGDHDGWISVGDNAKRLGVDPVLAEAYQASTWGINGKTSSRAAELARLHPAEYGEGYSKSIMQSDFEDAAARQRYEDDFKRIYGMSPDDASFAGQTGQLPLVRIRRWPGGTLSITGTESLADDPGKFVESLLKQDPKILNNVNKVVIESEDRLINIPVSKFLAGEWDEYLPLKRQVLERGRSGRPIRTAPLSGNAADQAILEQGAENVYRANPAPQFFSALERAVNNAKLNKATPEQWLGYLRNQPGVKAEELEWVKPLEGATGPLTKQQLQAAIAAKKVQLEESHKGGKQQYAPDDVYIDEDRNGQFVVRLIDDDTVIAGPFERRGAANQARAELLEGQRVAGDFYHLPEIERRSIMRNFEEFMDGPENLRAEYPTEVERREAAANWWADSFNVSQPAPATRTKYEGYQLPGGTNYRELLLRMPNKRREGDSMKVAKAAYERNYQRTENEGIPWDELSREEQNGWARLAERENKNFHPENFTSSHWEEPNVLVHTRMNDRDIPGVGRSLHIEEIQSDWHQSGRKKGYRGGNSEAAIQKLKRERSALERKREEIINNLPQITSLPEGFKVRPDSSGGFMVDSEKLGSSFVWGQTEGEAASRAVQHLNSRQVREQRVISQIEPIDEKIWNLNAEMNKVSEGVPDAPFKSTWADLALKRLIREAAEKNYDAISWTPGEAQAARYDLSKQIDRFQYYKRPDGKYNIGAFAKSDGSDVLAEDGVTINRISDLVGKEIAEKVEKGIGASSAGGSKVLRGLDLKVGGEGMKAFYDKMLVDKANALGKKYGARVEQAKERGKAPVLMMKLTPAMKRAALREGFPLFSGAPLPTGVVEERQERKAGGQVHQVALKALRNMK